MASRRCGCASDSCACVVAGGDGILVSGTGTATDPYVVDAAPTGVDLSVEEEGATVRSGVVVLNFVGGGITATPGDAGEVTVTVPTPPSGGGGGGEPRPIGEVTMWFGSKIDVPAGWLPLDGATFDGGVYPDLAAHLGSTTLPNFTDRFPMGAGTSSFGSTGGSATAALSIPNMPPHNHGAVGNHTHSFARGVTEGTGSGSVQSAGTGAANQSTGGDGGHTHTTQGSGTAFDVKNPWIALWFIIRAI